MNTISQKIKSISNKYKLISLLSTKNSSFIKIKFNFSTAQPTVNKIIPFEYFLIFNS